jgi:predicted metal-dependent HD superfamily phosphohydrolase
VTDPNPANAFRAAVGDSTGPAADAVALDLLGRYAEPGRHYHDRRHLTEVLTAVDALAEHADHPDDVRLAAWFHDAVYDVPAPAAHNERASAELAAAELTALGLAPERVARVAALVRATEHHEPGTDPDAAVLSDADLAILGSAPQRYAEYAAAVRAEYADVPEPDFRAGRAAILDTLLNRPHVYATATARASWEAAAMQNLTDEIATLRGPRPLTVAQKGE